MTQAQVLAQRVGPILARVMQQVVNFGLGGGKGWAAVPAQVPCGAHPRQGGTGSVDLGWSRPCSVALDNGVLKFGLIHTAAFERKRHRLQAVQRQVFFDA